MRGPTKITSQDDGVEAGQHGSGPHPATDPRPHDHREWAVCGPEHMQVIPPLKAARPCLRWQWRPGPQNLWARLRQRPTKTTLAQDWLHQTQHINLMFWVSFKIVHCLSLPEQSTTDLVASTTDISPSSGGCAPETKVSAGLVSPGASFSAWKCSSSPWSSGHLLLNAHPWCLCVQTAASYKDILIPYMGLGSILVTSFIFNYLFKSPSLNAYPFWGTGGQGFTIWTGAGGGTLQLLTAGGQGWMRKKCTWNKLPMHWWYLTLRDGGSVRRLSLYLYLMSS